MHLHCQCGIKFTLRYDFSDAPHLPAAESCHHVASTHSPKIWSNEEYSQLYWCCVCGPTQGMADGILFWLHLIRCHFYFSETIRPSSYLFSVSTWTVAPRRLLEDVIRAHCVLGSCHQARLWPPSSTPLPSSASTLPPLLRDKQRKCLTRLINPL